MTARGGGELLYCQRNGSQVSSEGTEIPPQEKTSQATDPQAAVAETLPPYRPVGSGRATDAPFALGREKLALGFRGGQGSRQEPGPEGVRMLIAGLCSRHSAQSRGTGSPPPPQPPSNASGPQASGRKRGTTHACGGGEGDGKTLHRCGGALAGSHGC